jgi:ribosomal subunit interface protein
MQIELVVKGTRMGNYARERMEHKLAKAVERFHREIPVRVAIEEKKGIFAARITSAVSGRELLSQSESRSMLEAVDEAVMKFERQLLKLSKRSSRGNHRHRMGHRTVSAMPASVVQDAEDQQSARVQTGAYAATIY